MADPIAWSHMRSNTNAIEDFNRTSTKLAKAMIILAICQLVLGIAMLIMQVSN